VNDVRTIGELERTLKTTEPELLQPARLHEIRTQGRRRRRTRLAMVTAGTAAVIVTASLGVAALTGVGADRADDAQPASPKPPKEMSALAKRALAEIPGAQQVSSWQVVLPTPVGAQPGVPDEQSVPDDLIDAGPIDIGARHYTGVTAFDRGAFPAWLYDGVSDYEKHVLGSEEEGYPVGSTDIGVVVDDGQMRLACMRPLPEWGGDGKGTDSCFPAMLGGADGHLVYEWGMGTEDFLHEGKGLELFATDAFSDGSAGKVWIGGTYGTDVASVDLVATDGTTVPATVASGTLVPGNTMFWGSVDGDLSIAVTRDAAGKVLEKHMLKPCSTPVECEVR
jgi:hypothetical protein